MRFEVPQFIDVEDKIFGPFTWKQFVYLAGGAGAAVMLFIVLPFFFFLLIGGPIIALAVFLAFHQVNNRPFSAFLESFVHYTTRKKLYLWKRAEVQRVTGEERVVVPEQSYQPESIPTGTGGITALSSKLELNTLEPETPE
ncbi:PrgI family protein [Candidatus Kaiserbacteria bacterium]|nr:PrgI family protein [Candidatus Kaiserbacteria bacterium]